MSKPDGGPAFSGEPYRDSYGNHRGHQRGMSLRDYFAGQALKTFASPGYGIVSHLGKEGVAKRAYEIADAMLEARGE